MPESIVEPPNDMILGVHYMPVDAREVPAMVPHIGWDEEKPEFLTLIPILVAGEMRIEDSGEFEMLHVREVTEATVADPRATHRMYWEFAVTKQGQVFYGPIRVVERQVPGGYRGQLGRVTG